MSGSSESEQGMTLSGGKVMIDQSAVMVVLVVAAAIREGELPSMLKSVMQASMEIPEISTKLLVPAALKPVPHWQQLNQRSSMKAGTKAHQSGTGHRRFR